MSDSPTFKIRSLLDDYERLHGTVVGRMENPPEVPWGKFAWHDTQPGELALEVGKNLQWGTLVDFTGCLSEGIVLDGNSYVLTPSQMMQLGDWAQRNAIVLACNVPAEDGTRRFDKELARRMYHAHIKSQDGGIYEFLTKEAELRVERDIRAELAAEQEVALVKARNEGLEQNREFILRLAEAASCRTDAERDEILSDAELLAWIKQAANGNAGAEAPAEH